MEEGRVRRELMTLNSQPQRVSRCKLKTGVSHQVCVRERDCETHMYIRMYLGGVLQVCYAQVSTFGYIQADSETGDNSLQSQDLLEVLHWPYLRDNKRWELLWLQTQGDGQV